MKEVKKTTTISVPEVKHTFRVVRKDAKGKIVRDDNEQPMYDEFVYDYNRMGISRMLAGRKLFHISNKEFQNTPANTDELTSLVTREAERQAFATILMKKVDEGFEKYNSYELNSFDALDELTCGEHAEKLMECQDHFFLKVGLQSPELMMQSLDITNGLLSVVKNWNGLKETTGLEMKEIMELLKDTSSQPEPKNEPDFTI